MISRKLFFINAMTGVVGYSAASQLKKFNFLPKTKFDKELVKQFVGAAHKDFDKVKSMLEENPVLLNGVHNLGGWDWEDAVGAAGHVGIPDLANYLLEKGARPTICVAAMLGKIEVVKAFIKTYPSMINAVGPHRISLIRHAKAGGENAKEVLEYLVSSGAKE